MAYTENDHVYLSKEGLEEIKKKLEELKTQKRVEIAKHLEYAKSLGDLSENAEYAEAKDEQMLNEADIVKFEDIVSRAEVIAHTTPGDNVRIGSTVVFKKPDGDRGQFTIVGKEEADPLKGKISNESPLGRAFLGRKKNEAILVSTPKGELQYKIIDIA